MTDNAVTASFTSNPSAGFSPLPVQFTNTSINATTYAWSLGDGNSTPVTNPSNTYVGSGTYTVVLIATNGVCTDTAVGTIIVNDNSSILIPNVFTPNSDGSNDLFFMTCVGISELHGDIFNRWGQKIFEINSPNQGWDGKTMDGDDASSGTYYLMLQAKGADGRVYDLQAYIGLFR
jgi:gliding motility-associated-like protein